MTDIDVPDVDRTRTPANNDSPERPDGALWYTFAFPLPFTLGLSEPDDHIHSMISMPPGFDPIANSVWLDPSASDDFGVVPIVRLRFHQQPLPGLRLFPEGGEQALESFYGVPSAYTTENVPLWGNDGSMYQQWVSLETPDARAVWESPEDDAFTFHRCVTILNEFLTSYIWAFGDRGVRPISTSDIGHLIFRGAYDVDKKWHDLGVMLAHPDQIPAPAEPHDTKESVARLESAVHSVSHGFPFITSKLWFWRALHAARRGDQVDRVISLQTAMENMFFMIWRLTMVDEHKTSSQIQAAFDRFVGFEDLFKSKLPRVLGGDWDRKSKNSPPAVYWRTVYLLRNQVVHTGYEPTLVEADTAEASYRALRKYMEDQLWAKRKVLPRTMMARIGDPAFMGYTKDREWVAELMGKLQGEPAPFWWPDDEAGRVAG